MEKRFTSKSSWKNRERIKFSSILIKDCFSCTNLDSRCVYTLFVFFFFLSWLNRFSIYCAEFLFYGLILREQYRVKVIGALPSVRAVEKFVYLRVAVLNDRWSNRVVNGFLEARVELREIFSRRYS